ncbi:hypothetical protein ACJX0J_008135, partial [Zea mays]
GITEEQATKFEQLFTNFAGLFDMLTSLLKQNNIRVNNLLTLYTFLFVFAVLGIMRFFHKYVECLLLRYELVHCASRFILGFFYHDIHIYVVNYMLRSIVATNKVGAELALNLADSFCMPVKILKNIINL